MYCLTFFTCLPWQLESTDWCYVSIGEYVMMQQETAPRLVYIWEILLNHFLDFYVMANESWWSRCISFMVIIHHFANLPYSSPFCSLQQKFCYTVWCYDSLERYQHECYGSPHKNQIGMETLKYNYLWNSY